MEPRVGDPVECHVHYHQGEEASKETQEDGQHEGGETGVFLFLFRCLAAQFAVEKRLGKLKFW